MIAEGIIAAVKEVGCGFRSSWRLEGTNAPLAREILAKSGLAITAGKRSHRCGQEGREHGGSPFMSILVDKNTLVDLSGVLRAKAGHLSFGASVSLWHPARSAGDAGTGWKRST